MKENSISLWMLFLFIVLGNSAINKVNAMDNKRFEQDIQDQQRLGRGNPIPLKYPQPTRGNGPSNYMSHTQISNDNYDDAGFFTDWNAIYPRNSQQKKYDKDVSDFAKRNKLYKNEDGSDLRSSDDEDNS